MAGFWATLVRYDDGLVAHAHSIHLRPEHRGTGLTMSFFGALRTYLADFDIARVQANAYGHDQWARKQLITDEASVGDVHVRKDL